MRFSDGLQQAQQLDADDPLAPFRRRFHFPKHRDGSDELYLVGHSLGLQPDLTQDYVLEELEKWRQLGVRGHFESSMPWLPYHEFLAEPMAQLVGGRPDEVVVMNSLTVNLHLMMVSFFRPTATRFKILIEENAFPSDHYAVESQLKHHGIAPEEALLTIQPRAGEATLRSEDFAEVIERDGQSIALILLPGVQYFSGQVLDMPQITQLGHAQGCMVGFDLAHAAGNIPLALHDWDVDFACWCTYKYLNSGPGAAGACFVHERHVVDRDRVRFAGWWGHNKATRFEMGSKFDPIPTAESWQLSNAPVLSMAAIRASLDLFSAAGGMVPLRAKSEQLTAYLDFLLDTHLAGNVQPITPRDVSQRGCQLSLRTTGNTDDGRTVFDRLSESGIACDWRYPDVIRVAPVPLYNSFEDVFHFVSRLKAALA